MMCAAGCPASHVVRTVYHNGQFKAVCLGCFPHMASCVLSDGGSGETVTRLAREIAALGDDDRKALIAALSKGD